MLTFCSSLHQIIAMLCFLSHPAGGFYSQRVKPGLRVISLNTILYYGPDKVTCNMTDPAGQYEWLEKTLEKAAQSQEKVWDEPSWTFDPPHSQDIIMNWILIPFNVAHLLIQVYIIAHVPVGYLPFVRNTTAIRRSHNERLVAICRKYSHVIAGHFYGHTHRDSIMVLLDQQGEKYKNMLGTNMCDNWSWFKKWQVQIGHSASNSR